MVTLANVNYIHAFKYFKVNHRDFTDEEENFSGYATMTTFNNEHLEIIRQSGINFHTHCGNMFAEFSEYSDFDSEINIPGKRL